MTNILILYNPYYQNNVIQEHLKILNKQDIVAFGKIHSKLKNTSHSFQDELQSIYEKVSTDSPMQLFLSDYANLFVAKVVKITSDDCNSIAPPYYTQKSLEVELWFIITDIRELVRNDFVAIRDDFLARFTTPHFGNHTYALYGNSYEYPLLVKMKQECYYFDSPIKHYPNIYKSDEFLTTKHNLITYSFGEIFINAMHPNTLDNIISAELEYQANKENPLYDFSAIIIKYSKSVEAEIFGLISTLLQWLAYNDEKICTITYEIQGKNYNLTHLFTHKANYGTYKYLLKTPQIAESIEKYCSKDIARYFKSGFFYHINLIQDIRNKSVHEREASLSEAKALRDNILGLSSESIILALVKKRCELVSLQKSHT